VTAASTTALSNDRAAFDDPQHLALFLALHRDGDGWRGKCPCCNAADTLWVSEHSDGEATFNCATGCTPDTIAAVVRDWHRLAVEGYASLYPSFTQPYNAEKSSSLLRPLTAAEFLTLDLPPRRLIVDPWLPEKGLAMIYSPRGMGKTLLALTTAYAIAAGAEFLGFKTPRARRVLYIDGEMPASEMQKRLAAIVAGFQNQPPDPGYFEMLSGDLTEQGLPDLGTPEGQAELDEQIGDAEVLILDNISTLVRSGRENEAEGWAAVQDWALRHRREGRSMVFVHHAGKSGAQRGTSKREDVLDTVVVLKRPADYSPDQGARFEVHFEKSRGFFGDAAQSFEGRYEVREEKAVWTRTAISDAEVSRVAEALASGMSIRETAQELGLHKSKVERLKKRAVEMGMLNV
jgi:putative DNA primase/helicase